MRPKTRNERALLAVLIGIIFVGGNYFAYQWLSSQQSKMELTYAQLRADKADGELDLQKADLWAKRREWIKASEPVLGEEGDAKAKVLDYVLKGARDHNLEILEQNINDTKNDASSTRIAVEIKVKGSMIDLCHWLAELQKPANFYAVSSFSLKADQDLKSYSCTLQVTRYFKNP